MDWMYSPSGEPRTTLNAISLTAEPQSQGRDSVGPHRRGLQGVLAQTPCCNRRSVSVAASSKFYIEFAFDDE